MICNIPQLVFNMITFQNVSPTILSLDNNAIPNRQITFSGIRRAPNKPERLLNGQAPIGGTSYPRASPIAVGGDPPSHGVRATSSSARTSSSSTTTISWLSVSLIAISSAQSARNDGARVHGLPEPHQGQITASAHSLT